MSLATAAVGCRKKGPAGVAGVIAPAAPASANAPPSGYEMLEGFCAGIEPASSQEYALRVAAIRARLEAAELGAVVLEPGPNMQYVAGVRWGRSERPFVWVLRADGQQAWICPSFEQRSAAERLPQDAQVLLWQEHEDPFSIAAGFVGDKAKVAVDPDARGFIFAGLAAHVPGARLDAEPVTATRLRKSDAEIARLRRANEATKAAIAVAASRLRVGMTQSAFAAEVTAAQEAAGLEQVWCLALFGPAASFPHGTREDRTLRADDVVLVDTGGSLHGYRSDVSRTWTLGEPSPEVEVAWHAVVEAQAEALTQIRDGVACGEADARARAVIERAGFGRGYERFTHRLGHGIGLQVHEPPYLRPDNARILRPGMTMSNEPGVYMPGAFGVRIEDIVVVTGGEPDVLGPPVGPFAEPLRGHLPA